MAEAASVKVLCGMAKRMWGRRSPRWKGTSNWREASARDPVRIFPVAGGLSERVHNGERREPEPSPPVEPPTLLA